MSPSWIRRRSNQKGRSYQVLFRRGGRAYPIETAGTFRTEREAKLRRDLVAGWLAQGLDPKLELAKTQIPIVRRTYADVALEWKVSRIDAAPFTAANLETHRKRFTQIFGDRIPDEITVADNIAAIAQLAAELKASSLRRYWGSHRQILDFAGVTPNPARDPAVKLPTIQHEEPIPPSATEFLALLDRTPRRWRLPLIVMEQTAMAVGETGLLEWGDVDTAGSRFRLRRATVKGQYRSRARWVQVPEWLMAIIEATCPKDDRTPTRRVFPAFTNSNAKATMGRACLAAGIAHYHPHDLRHRRISLWHGQGIPARELAARAGHANPSMSLNVYSHTMPLEEASVAALTELLVVPR